MRTPKSKKRPESIVQKEIVDFLAKVGITAWRQNSGLIKSGSRFIRVGKKGCPDIIGWWPDGKFLGIEVKSNGEPLTGEQADFIGWINHSGGRAIVAYELDHVVRFYKEIYG